MRNRDRQKGFLTFSGIMMILIVVAVIFCAFKLLPPYIRNYQLQDSINNIARSATYSSASAETIHKDVMVAAREAGVPLDVREVSVDRSRDDVNIAISYGVTVDLIVQPVTLKFNPTAGNRLITAK